LPVMSGTLSSQQGHAPRQRTCSLRSILLDNLSPLVTPSTCS
jgi:hypothetical protein